MTPTINDYRSDVENAWCKGCGNFAILADVKQALVDLDLAPGREVICSGIGQAPKLPHYMRVNTFNGLHGREVVSAMAVKLAAPDLTVLVHAGDGGAYGEGGNHLLHAMRRNVDITVIVHDNHYYALTKGQTSPTTPEGTRTSTDIHGVAVHPLNPLALAISQSCSFVAQALAGQKGNLREMIVRGVRHKGFALIHTLQPCVTWDKKFTYPYYREHSYFLGDEHDPADRMAALELAMRETDRFPLGVFYTQEQPVFEAEALRHVEAPLRQRPVKPDHVLALFQRYH